MTLTTGLKVGRIAAVLLLGAGLAGFIMGSDSRAPAQLMLLGGLLYAGCALTMWLRRPT